MEKLLRGMLLICLSVAFRFPAPLQAQVYNFNTYTVEDGLGGSEVYAILQDHEGYIWFGCYGGGISRFDGKSFRNYTVREGLADNRVLCLFEDSKQRLWIGTYGGGVSRFDGKSFVNYSTGNGLPSDIIYSIAEDKKGNIWMTVHGKGLCRLDAEQNGNAQFTLFSLSEGLESNELQAVFCDSKGRIWAGGGKGLACSADGKSFVKADSGHSLPGNVWSIYEDSKGNIWFGTYGNGVTRFDGSTFARFSDELSNNIVYSISEDPYGDLWFGTDAGGVSIYNGKSFRYITEKNNLCHNRVRVVLRDKDNNMWLGTDGGVNLYTASSFVMFNKQAGLNDDKVLSIQGHGNSVWLGTFGGGVTELTLSGGQDLAGVKNFTKADGLGSDRVWKIFRDNSGRMWFGTTGGLTEYVNGKFRNYSVHTGDLPSNMVYAIAERSNGELWIGTDGGVTIKSGQAFTTFTDKDGLSHNRVRTIVEDKDGNMWLGTYSGGVTRYDAAKKKFIAFEEDEKLKNAIVYAIVAEENGTLWFGTYGSGIVRHNPHAEGSEKRFSYFNSGNGLSSDAVLLLSFDRSGMLWAGTVKGLDRIDVKEYMKTNQPVYAFFGKSEGFKGIECNQNAVWCDGSGGMWFGCLKGAARYSESQLKKAAQGPQVHITDILLFHESPDWSRYADSVNYRTGIPLFASFPYSQNHITFHFSGLSFADPGKVRYRFFLEGFDKDWSPATPENVTTYANLAAGRYVFKVMACNSEGVWSNSPAIFSFTIEKPYWQTFWFYGLSSIVLLGSAAGVYRMRTGKLRRAKAELERMVRERTEELSEQTRMLGRSNQEKELLLKEIHHRVKNNLQIISSLLNLQSNNISDPTALAVVRQGQVRVRSMALVHQKLYQDGNYGSIDFGEYLGQLSSYVSEMYHEGPGEISCELDIAEKHFNIDTAIPLGLILTELLSNSYKYAFGGGRDGKISVSITRQGDGYLLFYSDNGPGLPPGVKFENSSTLGLELVSMLTSQLSGTMKTYNRDGAVFEIRFKAVQHGN
ncbi:MAG: two-component regulator propeller domain-containing protein [Bacteroidota bacterium]